MGTIWNAGVRHMKGSMSSSKYDRAMHNEFYYLLALHTQKLCDSAFNITFRVAM